MIRLRNALLPALLVLFIPGCVVYEPVPAYPTTTVSRPSFERSWNAALGAMQDNGVALSDANQGTGWITGKRNNGTVSIHVGQQPDGTVRVQIDTKDIAPQDQGLNDRVTQAYNRRMGR